jgi:2-keto-3-deoxy-L-rhamnonate aldolase RhmA
MSISKLRTKIIDGTPLAGTFMKTPSVDILEVLILSGLDFVCLDCEHAPFDRMALSACMALSRAADFPVLVRVPSAAPENIAKALDDGACGVVVPHVASPDIAEQVARAARFGHGGRGYAGSTRWAGFATRPMPDILAQSRAETIVIAQIEEPEGVDAADAIAATDGIDALFLGPADLTVAYGHETLDNPDLEDAMARTGAAAKANGKGYVTFSASAEQAHTLRKHGFSMFFIASEHAWILQGAKAQLAGIRALE